MMMMMMMIGLYPDLAMARTFLYLSNKPEQGFSVSINLEIYRTKVPP